LLHSFPTRRSSDLVDSAGNDKNLGSSWNAFRSFDKAIDVAMSKFNDTIIVRDGIYYCNVSYGGKKIVIQSMNGPKSTIIEPKSQYSPVFKFENNEPVGTTLSGFTIRNQHYSRIISCQGLGARVMVRNMIFTNSGSQIDGFISGGSGLNF
jgi:hypothetical protein